MEPTHTSVTTLDSRTCLELLAAGGLGRVALSYQALPVVLPIEFTFLDTNIVFIAAAGSILERATNRTVVAFEIDGLDLDGTTAWSVNVIGEAEHLGTTATEPLEPVRLPKSPVLLTDQVISLHAEHVTGQRWDTQVGPFPDGNG